jgi:peroxiredoxin
VQAANEENEETMLRRVALGVIATLAAAAPAFAAQVGSTTPEFAVRFNDGSQKLLSGYRGKVVCVLFVHTTCPHCQHTCNEMSKLYTEYGARGFQPIAVAWNDMANMLVPDFIKANAVNFPVGFAPRDEVLNYLGISPVERSVVPQIVWIDRKGVVRSQTPPIGDSKMLTEAFWREQIETLLKEPGPSAQKKPVHHRVAATHNPS